MTDIINKQYENIIYSKNFLEIEQEFNDFINIPCTIQDLKCFLKFCENNELYEWCISINNKIKSYGKE